jgi:MerC mercury resistance protein
MSASAHSHPHLPGRDPSDAVGQVLSAVCAVHCVSTPLVLAALPAAGSMVGGVHPLLFVLVLGVAAWAFLPGYRCHRQRVVPALAAAGLTLLGVAAFAFHGAVLADTGLSLVGASLMMAAHWKNRVALRACHQAQTAS